MVLPGVIASQSNPGEFGRGVVPLVWERMLVLAPFCRFGEEGGLVVAGSSVCSPGCHGFHRFAAFPNLPFRIGGITLSWSHLCLGVVAEVVGSVGEQGIPVWSSTV